MSSDTRQIKRKRVLQTRRLITSCASLENVSAMPRSGTTCNPSRRSPDSRSRQRTTSSLRKRKQPTCCNTSLESGLRVVYLALKTGLRRGELQGLCWSDINLAAQTLTVRHNWCPVTRRLLSPKGNRTRTIPLAQNVAAMLARRKRSEGYVFTLEKAVFDPHSMSEQLALASAKAGLPRITLHTLRHTFASQLAMKGVSIAVIQQLLGHTDIKTTMRYAHLSQNSLIEAVQQLETPLAHRNGCVAQSFGQYTGNRKVWSGFFGEICRLRQRRERETSKQTRGISQSALLPSFEP